MEPTSRDKLVVIQLRTGFNTYEIGSGGVMTFLTIDVAQLVLILGALGIIIAALRSETICKRLIRLLMALTKAVGSLIKLFNKGKK